MKRWLALLAFTLCCSEARPGGHGGAPGVSSVAMGSGGASVSSSVAQGGAAGHGGMGGTGVAGKDWDGGGEGGWIEEAGAPDAGCPPQPNGGSGLCTNPATDCQPLTLEQAACWTWTCRFGYCVAVPAQ